MELELVTIEEARHHLRLDDFDSSGGPDDPWLSIFIPAVSEAVATWLKDEWRLYVPQMDSAGAALLDSSGNPIPSAVVRPVVKGAALFELAVAFQHRGSVNETAVPSHEGYGYILSRSATAMLAGLRRATVR